MSKEIRVKSIASAAETDARSQFLSLYQDCPIPEQERLAQLGLFVKRQELTKSIYLSELYKKITDVHGVIMEFGVRWGQNLVTLTNLRGMYEPYNYSRKIIGFDTFAGFEGVSEKDGTHEVIRTGSFATSEGYENYLEKILAYHQSESPLPHIRKFELVKGNAIQEIGAYLKRHPETVVAFAYFDFDIYEPTARCLEAILPYMAKGGIIAFDELVDPHFPGETQAFRELLGNRFAIQRMPFCGIQSYLRYE